MAQPEPETEDLLRQFLNTTRSPLIRELKGELSCNICGEPYLSGSTPEVPVKLPCGHILGQSCVLIWLNPLSDEGRNSCPICREPVFDESDEESDTDEDDEELDPLEEGSLAHTIFHRDRQRVLASTQDSPPSQGDEDDDATATAITPGANVEAPVVSHSTVSTVDPEAAEASTSASMIDTSQADEQSTPPMGSPDRGLRGQTAVITEGHTSLGPVTESTDFGRGNPERTAAEISESASSDTVSVSRDQQIGDSEEHGDQEHAEHRLRRQIWLQFCEVVVRTVEYADDRLASIQAIAAVEILEAREINADYGFERLQQERPDLVHRLRVTFPTLYSQLTSHLLIPRLISGIDIGPQMKIEEILGRNIIGAWISRVNARVARIPPLLRVGPLPIEEALKRLELGTHPSTNGEYSERMQDLIRRRTIVPVGASSDISGTRVRS